MITAELGFLFRGWDLGELCCMWEIDLEVGIYGTIISTYYHTTYSTFHARVPCVVKR